MGMLEEQLRAERYTDLEINGDIRLCVNRGNHQKEVLQDNTKDKGKVHAFRWEVYKENKEGLIKREFLEEVPHPRGDNIVWACAKYNIIEEKQENEKMVLRGFDYTLSEEGGCGGG